MLPIKPNVLFIFAMLFFVIFSSKKKTSLIETENRAQRVIFLKIVIAFVKLSAFTFLAFLIHALYFLLYLVIMMNHILEIQSQWTQHNLM